MQQYSNMSHIIDQQMYLQPCQKWSSPPTMNQWPLTTFPRVHGILPHPTKVHHVSKKSTSCSESLLQSNLKLAFHKDLKLVVK